MKKCSMRSKRSMLNAQRSTSKSCLLFVERSALSVGRWAFVYLLLLAVAGPIQAAPLPDKDTPLDWVYPAAQPLRVHVVRGLWSREYRLEEALALTGAGFVTESWHSQGMGFGYVGGWDPNSGGGVPEFPDTAEDLLANHVLVVCNINAKAFTPSQQKLLQGFVQNGGGLLFLGGRFAFGSQWTNTPLAEIAPVDFVKQGFDLTNDVQGLPLTAGPDRLGNDPAPLRWAQAPRVFWYHDVKPKAGAQIAVVAGGHPLLIAGTYGKGRVAVFAGSVMGAPPAGALPLWQWDDWPRLMARTVTWLAAPRDHLNGTLSPAIRQDLTTALASLDSLTEDTKSQAALAAVEPLMVRAAKLCRDGDALLPILSALAAGATDPAPLLSDLLGRRAAETLGARGNPLAAKLLASGKPGKVAIGLRLAGAGRAPGAADTLVRALVSGEVEKTAIGGTSDGESLLAEPILAAPGGQKEAAAALIRLAALEGLAALGDPKTCPAIRTSIAANQPNGHFDKIVGDRGVEAYTIKTDTRLYQTGLLAALACGDATVAGPLADALLGNVYVASRARSGYGTPKASPATKLEGALPYILAWQVQMHAMLRSCPVERLAPLARELAALDDIRIVPSACAAFGGRLLTPDIKAALKTSKVKGVAALGETPL